MIIQNAELLEYAKEQFEKYIPDEEVKRLNEILYNIVKNME